MSTNKSFQLVIDSLPLLLQGAVMTVKAAICGIILGFILGVMIGVLQSKKLKIFGLSHIFDLYVAVIRGTPLYVQLLLVYYALPDLLGVNLSPFLAGIITLGFNSAAYIAETVRGGMNALAQGQWEACHVLGYSLPASLRYIILPQVMRDVLPALVNELIVLAKETSILSTIGLLELTKVGTNINARAFDPMVVYGVIALFYLAMTSVLAVAARYIEKAYAHD